MNHRKRHRLQHKVELPTLLKIVLAKKRNIYSTSLSSKVSIASQLATEAIELAQRCDIAIIVNNKKKRTVLESTKAVY